MVVIIISGIHAVDMVRKIMEGIVLDFSLDRGAYATTFLAHFLALSSGESVSMSIKTNDIDAKRERESVCVCVCGTGSLMDVKKRFKEVFVMREEKALSDGGMIVEENLSL